MLNSLYQIKKEFNDSLDKIEEFINFIELLKTLDFSKHKRSKLYKDALSSFNNVREKLLGTTTVQYNAIIISLYGAYELAIKKSTNEFIKFCIKNDIDLSKDCVGRYLESVSKNFGKQTKEANLVLIDEVYKFLIEGDQSKFRGDLSLNSYQNLKVDIVQAIAASIGVLDFLNRAKGDERFLSYIQEDQNLGSLKEAEEYIKQLNNSFAFIDNIVNSRNQIAHQGFEENMLNNDLIKKSIIPGFKTFVEIYIDFICIKCFDECRKCGANDKSIVGMTILQELNIINIYNNEIICFNSNDNIVEGNMHIIAQDGAGREKIGSILEIQSHQTKIEKSNKNQDIGCKLNVSCKTNYKYFLIK